MEYLKSCFLLLFPIILWNYIFYPSLPEAYQEEIFWNNIPTFISIPENIFRWIIFGLPFLMKFELQSKNQQIGFKIYLIGILIYFGSWIMQIYFPDHQWSTSMIGFIAPAFTSAFLILSVSLIGQNSIIKKIKGLSMVYFVSGLIFLFFHTWHAALVYKAIQVE